MAMMRYSGAVAKGRFAEESTQHLPAQRLNLVGNQNPQSSVSSRLRARPLTQQAVTKASQSAELPPRANADNPVVVFLRECGLHMHAAKFLQHGFDEMETLHAIEEADMKALGLAPFHAVRLQKGLRELRQKEAGDQANAGSVVVAFLEECGLGKYSSVLLSSGFEEMETLLDVDDIDLKDLGFPRGHALKLKRHLRDYQMNLYAEEAQQNVTAEPSVIAKGVASSSKASPPKAALASRPAPSLEASETMKGDVARSWDMVQERGTNAVGERVYRVFFDMAPEAMDRFPAHVRHKYREWTADESDDEADLQNSAALRKLFAKVLNAVGCVVAGLQDSSKLVPLLTSLGGRHIVYNTNVEFWPILGKAVMITLAELLGDAFTPEVENAWNVVYGFASSIMISGLKQAIEAAWETALEDGDCATSHKSRASQNRTPDELHVNMLEDSSPQRKPAADDAWHHSVSESTMATEH